MRFTVDGGPMSGTRGSVAGLIVVALLSACSDDRASLPVASTFDATIDPTLSGVVLGPAGSICNSLPDGTPLVVRIFTPGALSPSAIASPVCPDNTYAAALNPGTYFVRVQLPADPSVIGQFPWRTITPVPFLLDATDVTGDVTIAPGTALGGSVTFDGAPVPDAPLTLVYDQATSFGAAVGSTGPDGAWMDFFGRSPMVLQPGVRYQGSGLVCDNEFSPFFLGSQVLQSPPQGSFLFPDEVSRIDCAVKAAPTTGFSHDRTPLVVTPMPGDIGGLSPELFDQFGSGWGIQLLGPGESAQHASITRSQLYRGGLIVGIRPDRVLSGIGLDGYTACAPACRDFGLDAEMRVASSPRNGKRVAWRYSDAQSPEGVGLNIVQRSYDGILPASYVLFRFTFSNSARTAVKFDAGVFMDWDVGNADFDAFDDVGQTARHGRLMFMTNGDGSGPWDGTLIVGAPVAGNAFLTDFGQSNSTVVGAIAGDFTTPAVTTPSDYRYIHTVGPISLKGSQSADIWVAVISGMGATAFSRNADLAAADIARRQGEADDRDRDDHVETVRPGQQRNAGMNPRCKRGCAGH